MTLGIAASHLGAPNTSEAGEKANENWRVELCTISHFPGLMAIKGDGLFFGAKWLQVQSLIRFI